MTRHIMQSIGAFLWWLIAPLRLLWGEAIGLRTEQIRSLSVVTGIVFLFRGYDHMEHGASLTAPHVVVTLICLVMTFGLAWQATRIKGQIAGLQVELGQQPTAAERQMAQPIETLAGASRQEVDDPDEGDDT